jgi:hypothetical protein
MVTSNHPHTIGVRLAPIPPNGLANCPVVCRRHRLEPFPVLLIALSGSGYTPGAPRRTEAAMRHRILVAWLTALTSDHSFSTLSQILRNLALCYGTGVQVLAAAQNIPLRPVNDVNMRLQFAVARVGFYLK